MTRLATVLAGLVLAGAAAPAFAQTPAPAPVPTPTPASTFELFKQVCLDSDGSRRLEAEAARRNAFALGTSTPVPNLAGLTNAFMFGWTGDGMRTRLVLGEDGALESCMLTSRTPGQSGLVREVEAWMGFPADARHVDGTVTNFHYAQTDQGRVPQWDATLEQQREMVLAGTIRVVSVNVTAEGAVLSFTAPPKTEAAR